MDNDRILLDIETQREFFQPGGNCYSRRSTEVAKRVYRLFHWARENQIPVVSTLLRVRRGETGPLADVPHCIEDSEGEKKLTRTVLPRRINLGLRSSTDLPVDLFDRYQQVIFEKRDTDILSHPRLERLISELPPVTFVICGAGLAHGIMQAAVGLRTRGFSVIVAEDAALCLDDEAGEMARLRMEAKGTIFAPTAELTRPPVRTRARRFRTALHTE
ncbi:MAG: isochorismatase family protein [Phycisphaerae bacterium]